MNVTPGESAPPVALEDQNGRRWRLDDHLGAPVVLYFYPADDTTGCTNQACNVRDSWSAFADAGVTVAGISPDDVASHERFAAKHDLPHTLLADPERKVIDAYGAWGEKQRDGQTYEGVIRSSVVIGPQGQVAAVFDSIKPDEQAERSLAAVRELQSG